jgi:radical SAM protein with 4Fe4S-binding SPASM domain
MCHLWQYEKSRDLSVEEVQRIFEDNDFSSLTALTLTGGEPTLRGDLVDLLGIITHACPRLHQVTLATNGLESQRVIEQVKSCLREILDNSSIERFVVQVSLDGIGELHDRIRGVRGFHDRVIETLTLLKEMAREEQRLALKISSTVQPANVDSVHELQELAKGLGIPIRFGALVFSPCYYENTLGNGALRFAPEQATRAAAVFSELADADPGANVKFYYRDAARMMLGAQRAQTCMMGYYGFVIEYDGNVYPCVNCEDRTFGNLCKQSFRELWWGAHAQAIRCEMRARCCPVCASICYTLPSNLMQAADIGWRRLLRRVDPGEKKIEY